jgi:hypothetical protein
MCQSAAAARSLRTASCGGCLDLDRGSTLCSPESGLVRRWLRSEPTAWDPTGRTGPCGMPKKSSEVADQLLRHLVAMGEIRINSVGGGLRDSPIAPGQMGYVGNPSTNQAPLIVIEMQTWRHCGDEGASSHIIWSSVLTDRADNLAFLSTVQTRPRASVPVPPQRDELSTLSVRRSTPTHPSIILLNCSRFPFDRPSPLGGETLTPEARELPRQSCVQPSRGPGY